MGFTISIYTGGILSGGTVIAVNGDLLLTVQPNLLNYASVIIVDLRINETLELMKHSKSAQLETAPTKYGGQSVFLFFEFTIVLSRSPSFTFYALGFP